MNSPSERGRGIGKKKKMFVRFVVLPILGLSVNSAGNNGLGVFHLPFLETESVYLDR